MAEILGRDLDNWDDSLAAREPYNLSDSSDTGYQFMTGSDLMRSARISSEWKMPVAIPAQATRETYKIAQPFISAGTALSDVIANYVPNLESMAAQSAIELVEGEEKPKSIREKLLQGTEVGALSTDIARVLGLGMIGVDAIANRKEYEEKIKTYDDAVMLLDNRDYPLTKYARRVLADTTHDVETRRIVRELYNQAQGIDSSKWYNQAGSIIGAMIPTMAIARGAGATARAFGATRLGAIQTAQNVAKGFIGGQMAGEYAEETAREYLDRTGDKTFENFTAKDAGGLSAMAYGAIGAQIEFMGGVEPIMAGALSKVGLRSSLLKAGAKIGVGEATEEFLQGITEILMRKIDGTTDKTWKEGFKEALNGAVWGLFLGGTMGTTAFYTNRRNLVKGIKTALPNISDTQAQLVADAMIDSAGEVSSQDPTLRNDLRKKVAMMYETSEIENKEDRIDAITDLEYGLIAMDSAERGIEIAENPLFKGEVNELGWFREGIPENRRAEIQGYITELNDLKDQLKKLNEAEQKDWDKIDELESKLDKFNTYVLDKLSDLARDDASAVRRMMQDIEQKYVQKEKKKAGIEVPTDWFDKNITKGNTFTTEEGTFTEYQLKDDTRNMATFTVFESPDGWIVRNAYVPESMQKKGIATNFYIEMNKRSIDATGNPLRSTQPRTLQTGETVFELSEAGRKLWDSLAKKGMARKLADETYKFEKPIVEFQEQFDLADENARLDEKYPAYEGETIEVNGKERTVYNSNGDRIAKSKEALTNFWKWFGDSKVVDDQGRPLVVYHGTEAEFDTFESIPNMERIFTAKDRFFADMYGRNIMPMYSKIVNPLNVDFKGQNAFTNLKVGEYQSEGIEDIARYAREQGYDGVIAKNVKDYGYRTGKTELTTDEYIPFESKQLKSVDNRGTYSEKTGNIYFQSAYAGSRVDYDRPSLEAIGSGEGNQAHGWGLYYALDPEIAEGYMLRSYDSYQKNNVRSLDQEFDSLKVKGKPILDIYDIDIDRALLDLLSWKPYGIVEQELDNRIAKWEQLSKDPDYKFKDYAVKKIDAYNRLKTDLFNNGMSLIKIDRGQVHEVDIPEMDVLLDEQQMLIDQPQYVQDIIQKINKDLNLGIKDSGIRGSLIYYKIAEKADPNGYSEKAASELLDKYGIKGITYYGRKDGRCFVIFNPESVKVLRKKFDELGNVLFQNRVSGGAPSTYRGAYIPQYRFIQRANKMDASTLSHELAHDWFEVNFARYRSGEATKDFMRAWGALEKALGVAEDAKVAPRKASEAFARAYEGWIMNKTDWEKLINVDEKDKDAIVKLMQDYQSDLRDMYQDLTSPYFKETWGKLGELKPELQDWFDRAVNITNLDRLVERGEITTAQAAEEKLNRSIDTAIENTTDAETKQTLKEARTLNDTKRYEVEGGNKNSLQDRLSNLAREIDENNMLLKKERYDTRRDMMQVAESADNFVKTRLDDALAIINGEMAEVEGLYKEDIYTALERLAVENGDLGLLNELKNSEVANRLAKELGQRVAGFRNWKQSTDVDVVSALKSLDNRFNKALENKKAQKQFNSALDLLDESLKNQDKIADKDLESILNELECK